MCPSSAIGASIRANGEGLEALYHSMEVCCSDSSERSAVVVQANVAAIRSETEPVALAHLHLLIHLLTKLDDGLLAFRLSMAIERPHGLVSLVLELMETSTQDGNPNQIEELTPSSISASSGGTGSSPVALGFNQASRCYMCVRAILELGAMSSEMNQWLEDVLLVEEIDAMGRWLKDISRTAALGRQVERSRFLGVARRRSTFERTEEQQTTIDQLRGLLRSKRMRASGAAK